LFRYLLAVFGGREKVPLRPEVRCDGPIGGRKALGMPSGLEPLHPSVPLSRGSMGVFGTVVQIAVLPMFHVGQGLALGSSVAPQLICDDDPWDICREQMALIQVGGGVFMRRVWHAGWKLGKWEG
jgi:hypothetical protein